MKRLNIDLNLVYLSAGLLKLQKRKKNQTSIRIAPFGPILIYVAAGMESSSVASSCIHIREVADGHREMWKKEGEQGSIFIKYPVRNLCVQNDLFCKVLETHSNPALYMVRFQFLNHLVEDADPVSAVQPPKRFYLDSLSIRLKRSKPITSILHLCWSEKNVQLMGELGEMKNVTE